MDFGHRTATYFQSTNTFRFQTMSDLSGKTKNAPKKFNKKHPKAEVKTAVSEMENLSYCSQLFQ